MEVIIDAPAFADIKYHIEDSAGDELIRRIKEVYPDLDLAFLTVVGSDSPHGSNGEQEIEHDIDPSEARPEEGEQEGVESKTVDPDSISPHF